MHRDRERVRRAIGGLLVLASVVACGRARAADIRVHASHDCVERADIADQVDAVLGRPVAAVQGLDFDVDIAEGPPRRWHLRLATIDRSDGAKRSREIDGSSCAQLADAAAVAIAMSIQSSGAAAATGFEVLKLLRRHRTGESGQRRPAGNVPLAVQVTGEEEDQ